MDNIEDIQWRYAMEDEWMERLETQIEKEIPLPSHPSQFIEWQESLKYKHEKASKHFYDYLAEKATKKDIAQYILHERSVDGVFDDLLALAQLGVQGKPKMAIAHNYWDEMGEGNPDFVHTTLFDKTVKWAKDILQEESLKDNVEILQNSNSFFCMGFRRRYAPRIIGALSFIETIAPVHFEKVVAGCKRLSVPSEVIFYQEAHIEYDAAHAQEWIDDAIIPLINKSEVLFKEICLGVAIRYLMATQYANGLLKAITQED
ncbi:iron-containing redox enzyme family protein [Vibrio cholerae]|nr:iron-containing redox enzyme family protein [Vibrio cholerae]